ncbi:hypothetical protein L195_g017086 [Trifolium pratense]|uniref:Uncharacterized protein n=1 Tax=Trifolium pratense TaxID=57577 RepID=A0A2K3MSY6_TRIPR|nr:hypothetical protein L195_g017086 [Trifolium pratense]
MYMITNIFDAILQRNTPSVVLLGSELLQTPRVQNLGSNFPLSPFRIAASLSHTVPHLLPPHRCNRAVTNSAQEAFLDFWCQHWNQWTAFPSILMKAKLDLSEVLTLCTSINLSALAAQPTGLLRLKVRNFTRFNHECRSFSSPSSDLCLSGSYPSGFSPLSILMASSYS